MSIEQEEFVEFSHRINEELSAFMLGSQINVETYHHTLFWEYVKSKGVSIIEYPFDGPARSRISGLIVKDEHETTIGFNKLMNQKRINFTVCHEIIHYLYHLTLERQFFTDTKDSLKYYDADQLVEFQANIGASAILIPEPVLIHELKSGTHPFEISDKFGISAPALNKRLVHTMQAEFDANYLAAQKMANSITMSHSTKGKSVMIELGKNLEKKNIFSNPFYEAICI